MFMLCFCAEIACFMLLGFQADPKGPESLGNGERALLEAAAKPGTEGTASLALARFYSERGNLDQALSFAKTAAAHLPQTSEAHTALARAISAKMSRDPMFAMSHLELFRSSVEKAIELNPNNFQAWRIKIGFQLYAPPIAGGSLEAAKQTLGKAREIGEELGLYLEAAVLEREEKFEDRLEVFRQLVERDPDNREYRKHLGHALLTLARFERASDHFEAMFAQDPTDSECLYRAASAKIMGETRLETAIRQLERYIDMERERNPDAAARAYCRMARAHRMRQQPDLASNAYAAALKLDPENAEAREALEKAEAEKE